MADSSSGMVVAGLTTVAVATVGVLAFQAYATVPAGVGRAAKSVPTAAVASKAPRDRRNPTALPASSGTGERVVYSVDDDRVWLVSARGKVLRTFKVAPGSVDPAPDSYSVDSRSNAVTGTDGAPIEHVVRFASVDGIAIGFSAAVRPPQTRPAPDDRTGGIRESRADGEAMWQFATIGQRVVVIR
ncbi:hypothetical protein ACIQU5_15485 [Streptomyces sp. NPDC090306]|uniref:hypothetical protein n=1 Tax=Streptomyces sp. NPDC090306 TaxID=3365961 RepID=UPI00380AFC94